MTDAEFQTRIYHLLDLLERGDPDFGAQHEILAGEPLNETQQNHLRGLEHHTVGLQKAMGEADMVSALPHAQRAAQIFSDNELPRLLIVTTGYGLYYQSVLAAKRLEFRMASEFLRLLDQMLNESEDLTPGLQRLVDFARAEQHYIHALYLLGKGDAPDALDANRRAVALLHEAVDRHLEPENPDRDAYIGLAHYYTGTFQTNLLKICLSHFDLREEDELDDLREPYHQTIRRISESRPDQPFFRKILLLARGELQLTELMLDARTQLLRLQSEFGQTDAVELRFSQTEVERQVLFAIQLIEEAGEEQNVNPARGMGVFLRNVFAYFAKLSENVDRIVATSFEDQRRGRFRDIRQLVAEDCLQDATNEAFKVVLDRDALNEIITLQARMVELRKQERRNTATQEYLTTEFQKVRFAFLDLLEEAEN